MQTKKKLTILELFRTVQDTCRSDEEVVAVIDHMMRTRRIVRREQSLLG